MEIALLLVALLLAVTAGFGFLWRKLEDVLKEIVALKDAVGRLEMRRAVPGKAQAAKQRQHALTVVGAESTASAQSARDAVSIAKEEKNAASSDPFSEDWVRPSPQQTNAVSRAPLRPVEDAPRKQWTKPELGFRLTLDSARAIVAAFALALPVLGFALGWSALLLVLTGLGLSTCLVLASIRLQWIAPAWVAALSAGAWALVGVESNAASQDLILFSVALGLTAAAGFAQALLLRREWSGAMMSALCAAAALALAARTSLISPPGYAYAAMVAVGAAIGAARLRRDALHVGAFVGAMLGLLVLSAQDAAANWFTPAAAWCGAIFLGIAAVRVPALGSRGALVAATGVIAPLFAAASLYASQHLEDPRAAAAAFAALAIIFGCLTALAAQRAGRVGELRLTAWVLIAGATIAASAAFKIVLPPAVAAGALAGLTLTLVGADSAWRSRIWRCFAALAALATCIAAFAALSDVNAVSLFWGEYGTTWLGLALPALVLGLAAASSRRAPVTSGWLEACAIALALSTLGMLTRLVFSGGAPLLQPVSFVELGVHEMIWLGAAFVLAARAELGAGDVRRTFSALLVALTVVTSLAGSALWLTSYWSERAETALNWPMLNHAPLGFALPALLAWAHWLYWRTRRAPRRTRFALAAAGLLTAAFVTGEVALRRALSAAAQGFDWITLAAFVFTAAAALALQLAPGVALHPIDGRQLDLEEYLKRHRRREQRR